MPSEFVNAVTKHNLCTWYLVPLICLNKISFGQGNFIESYVNAAGDTLTIEVITISLVHPDCLNSMYYLAKQENISKYALLWYYLPKRWKPDFERFKAGQYSKFSPRAKHLIREYSGLMINEYGDDGTRITDARIHALEKSPILRKAWENELRCLPLSPDMELLDVPPDRTYREYP